MPTAPERWSQQSQYDLETARAMFETGRYLYVLFCCQQSVEKKIKGIVTKRTGEFPPRTHNLMRLAEVAALEMDESKTGFLRELAAYYIQSRYPEEMDAAGAVSSELARDILQKTEETIRWLSSML